jgi:hypothetical protein
VARGTEILIHLWLEIHRSFAHPFLGIVVVSADVVECLQIQAGKRNLLYNGGD